MEKWAIPLLVPIKLQVGWPHRFMLGEKATLLEGHFLKFQIQIWAGKFPKPWTLVLIMVYLMAVSMVQSIGLRPIR